MRKTFFIYSLFAICTLFIGCNSSNDSDATKTPAIESNTSIPDVFKKYGITADMIAPIDSTVLRAAEGLEPIETPEQLDSVLYLISKDFKIITAEEFNNPKTNSRK